MGQSLNSESNCDITNENKSYCSKNEETMFVQSFSGLGESFKKDFQSRTLSNPESAFRGIIQKIDFPSINTDTLPFSKKDSIRPSAIPDSDQMHVSNSLSTVKFLLKDPLSRHYSEVQEDNRKISLHTEDYRISEMVEEIFSRSNDSVEETRFHHETLPPYEISKENFSMSSVSPELELIKVLQRANQTLQAASKGKFNSDEEKVLLSDHSSHNNTQNATAERANYFESQHSTGKYIS